MLTIDAGTTSFVSVRISKDTNIGQYNDTLQAADLGPAICAELLRADATNTPIDPSIKQQIRDMAQARVQAWKDLVRTQSNAPPPTKADRIAAANSVCDSFDSQLDQVLADPTVKKAECRAFKDRLQADIDKINAVIAVLQG